MVRVGNGSESNFFGTRVPAVHNKKVPMVRESFRVFWTDILDASKLLQHYCWLL